MKKYILITATILLIASAFGCKKYLDEKPDGKLNVPATLKDFQALLDYYPAVNIGDPSAGEVSADNYYLLDADYLGLTAENYRRMYTWEKENLFTPGSNEWFTTYRTVYSANTILEGLTKITPNTVSSADFNNVKGQALFARAKELLKIAGIWTAAYQKDNAASQLGIPLRLSSDYNIPSVRSNLKQTYEQIIADFTSSAALLPVKPLVVFRPSKPAAFAMLARTYLFIGDYTKAALYADSCLTLYNTLIDFNTLNAAAAFPIAKLNPEVIQESLAGTAAPLNPVRCRIDSNLYRSYAPNDLRKSIFFKPSVNGTFVFKGSYEGSVTLFVGIATDEVYLIRAECNARNGKTTLALKDLNTLMINRFATGTFTPYTAGNNTEALNLILTERRKELLMRGLRWDDLKRFNRDGANITVKRIVQGKVYSLAPNDLRYALPIPEDVIQLSGMPQNPR